MQFKAGLLNTPVIRCDGLFTREQIDQPAENTGTCLLRHASSDRGHNIFQLPSHRRLPPCLPAVPPSEGAAPLRCRLPAAARSPPPPARHRRHPRRPGPAGYQPAQPAHGTAEVIRRHSTTVPRRPERAAQVARTSRPRPARTQRHEPPGPAARPTYRPCDPFCRVLPPSCQRAVSRASRGETVSFFQSHPDQQVA